MVWFYLFCAILLADGRPAAPIPIAFHSMEECEAAGAKIDSVVTGNPDQVKADRWSCVRVDFGAASAPAPAPRHIPGPHEA